MALKTRKFLKDNKLILFIKSDKCKKAVILNKSDYERSMDALLSDEETYKKKTKPDCKDWESGEWYDQILESDKPDKWWTNEKYLQTHNSIPPAIYGLAKLHKWIFGELLQLRPVVVTIQSPTYKISELIAKCVSNIIHENLFRIKDSWQFSQYRKDPERLQNVFTRRHIVVHEYSKRIVHPSHWKKMDEDQQTLLSKQYSYFKYGDFFDVQKAGVAMGNSISGFLADSVEIYVLKNSPFIIPFYRIFVDDILVFAPDD